MSDQPDLPMPKLDHGQIITIEGEKFEVLHISLNTDEEYPICFHYELVLAREAEDLRALNDKAAKDQAARADERARLEAEAEEIGVTEITEQRFPTNESLQEAIDFLKEHKAHQEQIRQDAQIPPSGE